MDRYAAKSNSRRTVQSEINCNCSISNVSMPSSDGTSSTRSSSIPLPISHIARTQSEVQLAANLVEAEQRDVHMFYRLVNGIRERQIGSRSYSARATEHEVRTERCLARILRARQARVDSSNNIMLHEELDESLPNGPSHANAVVWIPPPTQAPENTTSDGWSITGFDGPAGPEDDRRAALQDDVEEDEGVFALDL